MSIVARRRLLRLIAVLLATLAAAVVPAAPVSAADTVVVTTTADTVAADGDCSLREAIQATNTNATVNECVHNGTLGTDTIAFDFSGLGQPAPYVITVTGSDLPNITAPVTIDGLTEPMVIDGLCPLQPFPDPPGSLSVRLDGGDTRFDGLVVGGNGSIVRGLSVTNFTNAGIILNGSNGSVFCNYVGVDTDGSDAGTNGNVAEGILLAGGTNNAAGGLNFGEGNLIARNGNGVETRQIQGHVRGNIIRDNVFNGVFVNATNPGVNNNSVEQNVITGNGDDGVQLSVASASGTGPGNLISQNSIFDNGTTANDLGIDIFTSGFSPAPDGVNPNDPGDTDTLSFANNGQNYPVLTSASSNGSNTTVTFTLDSLAGGPYTIEFFSNPACDTPLPTGHGEGKTYLGNATAALPGGPFTVTTLDNTAPGTFVTATATSSGNDTSEFSLCRLVSEPAQAGPTLTVTTPDDHDDGVCGPQDCSLREAILRSNALSPGPNTIQFNMPAIDVQVIHVTGSDLPNITAPVTIDGLTQRGITCPYPSGSLSVQIDGGDSRTQGLRLLLGSAGSTIRGLSITNFTNAGIFVDDSNMTFTCNYLGVEADGSDGGTNGNQFGIAINSRLNSAVGGPSTSDGNLIASNTTGVFLGGGANHRVQGNTVRNNTTHGVQVLSGTGNLITQNSIFSNGTTSNHLGIDIDPDGVTPNDPGDTDGGVNNRQNFPVLARASVSGGSTTVVGTLDSVAGQSYTVEFFSNPACDTPNGNGEGQVYLGNTVVTIPAGPTTAASFSATLPTAVTLGQVVTATASRNTAPLDTSEFSACRTVTGPPGVTVVQSGGTTAVAEGGATDTFTVVLDAPPAADVTIALTSAPAGQLQPIPSLTFTPANFATPQTVTVAAVDDNLAESNPHTATITLATTSTDAGYNALAGLPTVSVSIADNDTPGVTVTQSGGSTAVTEAGATDTFTVVLNTQPTADVTIAFSSAPAGQLQPIASLTFTPANFSTAQTVTVTAVDDSATEGPHTATITLAASSADPAYNGVSIPTVSVAIADNDTPGFTVSPTSGLTTTEAGGTATFTVRLNTAPTADVTIPLSSSDTTEGTVSPSSLTFTPANYATPQTVTVTGVQDTVSDGSVAYTIVTGPATSADAGYNGLNPPDVAVTNTDEAVPAMSIGDATVAEGDGSTSTLTFTVTLSGQSTGVVTAAYATTAGSATGGGACAPTVDYLNASGTVTFPALSTQQTIGVTVCPDAEVEAPETVAVNLGTPTGATLADGQGVGTITDDDVAGSVTFAASAVQVSENAGSVTLTVTRTGVSPASTGPGGPSRTATGSVPSGSITPASGPGASTTPGAGPSAGTIRPSAASPISVNFATANGTATAGQDYTATAGTLSFGVNETTKTIVVPILSDGIVESPETFTVKLSAPTGGATLGPVATVTVTIVDATPAAAEPQISPGDDDTDKPRKETEDERRQREHTNAGNKDDVYVEGNVAEVHQGQDEPSPYVVIANKDGLVKVVLRCGDRCPKVQVGDYLEADGEKESEALFYADEVTVWRNGERVK